jgi:hypothetical protein
MTHTKFDQFNDLVTRLAAADGTVAAEHSHEILDTELASEVLEAIVAGMYSYDSRNNPYAWCSTYASFCDRGPGT